MGTSALGPSGLSKDDWVNLYPEVRGTGILTGALRGGVALLQECRSGRGLHRVTLLGVGTPREKASESGLEDESVRGKAREQQAWKQGRLGVPDVLGVQRGWGADFHGPVKRCRCESGVSPLGGTSAPIQGWAVGLAQSVTTPGSSCQIHEWGFSTALRTEAPSSHCPRWLTGLFISGV